MSSSSEKSEKQTEPEEDDDEEDLFEKRIENSGCSKQHYQLQVSFYLKL